MAPLNKQIPDIMDRFGFASVRLAMLALNWTWAAAGGKTPDIDRLKSTAFQLMDQAVRGYEELDEESKKYGYVAATGGFEARGRRLHQGWSPVDFAVLCRPPLRLAFLKYVDLLQCL